MSSRPALRFGVLVIPDAAPTIRFELAGESRRVTPAGRIAYIVAAEDDHGFSRLWLARSERTALDERADEDLPVTTQDLEARAVESEGRFAARIEREIDLAPLKLEPGTTLTLQAFASDNDALGGPKTAASQREAVLIVDMAILVYLCMSSDTNGAAAAELPAAH